jgi:pyrophosphate--fructose-6-phosphate 1-phosphotransferase
MTFEDTRLYMYRSEINSLSCLYTKNFPNLQSDILKVSGLKTPGKLNKNIAILFSGGPAPGGHTVVVTVAKFCEATKSNLYAVQDGPGGLIKGKLRLLTYDSCKAYYNTGGFELLGTDRTKIKSDQQYKSIEAVVKQYQLDAIIIIGGDDSHTNAVFLAQYLSKVNCAVIGVPKTIDGDLRFLPYLPISFGFHTAVDTYANLVKALIKDTESTKKYWHIVKLMGRSTGHIARAVGQIAKPDFVLLGEDVRDKKLSYADIITQLCDVIQRAQKNNKDYGVICIAEGLLEWIPNFDVRDVLNDQVSYDSHGNLELSRLELEQLLIKDIKKRLEPGADSDSFKAIPHFYGYEGRCVDPNEFDANLCEKLGVSAASLALQGYSGYMATEEYAVPIACMLSEELRQGKIELVVQKFV